MGSLHKIIPFNIKHGNCGGSLVQYQQGEEIENALPFIIGKVLVSYDMKTDDVRGRHAHHKTEEIVVALNGGCTFKLDDGKGVVEYVRLGEGELNQPAHDLDQSDLAKETGGDAGQHPPELPAGQTTDENHEHLPNWEQQDLQPALLLYPRVWRTFYDFEPNTVLLVVANMKYDEKDYIRDRAAFEHFAKDWSDLGGSATKKD